MRHLPEQAHAARALLSPSQPDLPNWTVLMDTADTGRHSTLHWHLPDPAGAGVPAESRLVAYRRIRDELSVRLVPFIELALRTAAGRETTFVLQEVSNG